MKLKSIATMCTGKHINRYDATYINKAGNEKVYELVSHNKNISIDNFGSLSNDIKDIKTDAVGIIAFNKDFSKVLIQKEN